MTPKQTLAITVRGAGWQHPKAGMPDGAELIRRLEEVRAVAMAASPPQASAAVAAFAVEAKIANVIIERSAVLTHHVGPETLGPDANEQAYREIRDQHGEGCREEASVVRRARGEVAGRARREPDDHHRAQHRRVAEARRP